MITSLNRLSIVIVTWNGDHLLKDCLDSLITVYGTLPETVVVDNANLSSTAALVGSYANAKYVPLPENRGFAGGNNAALPFCTKDFILLLNNDTKFTADSIAPLVAFMDEHSNCAAAQGKILLPNGRLDGTGGFLNPLGTLAFRNAFAKDNPTSDIPERVLTVGGAFFLARRSAIAAAGGLFYDHFKSYYEEIDFCIRLNLAGFECWYVPTPPILHIHSATANRIGWDRIKRQYYRNIWFSNLTCFGFWTRLRFCTTLLALGLAESFYWIVRGKTQPLKAHLLAIADAFRNRKQIVKTRNHLLQLRKLTDRQFRQFAIRSQPWSYYKAMLRRG